MRAHDEQFPQISMPVFETRPSRSLPPDEFCLGVRPRKATKSRGPASRTPQGSPMGPFGWNSRVRCALTNAEQYFAAAGRLGDEPHKSHALLGPLGVDATEKANSPFIRQEI